MATANAIAQAYYRRIKRKEITSEDVPKQIRKAVEDILKDNA